MSLSARSDYDAYVVLRNHDFRLFLAMRFFLTLGIQIQGTVVGWQIYEMTKDPLSLGLIGLTEAIPFMALILYGGHLADLYSRKKLIVYTLMGYLVGAGLLFLFTLQPGDFLHQYGTFPIYAVIFMTGIARAFSGPAVSSFMPELVEKSQYANAATWNSTFWQTAAVSGPALGGFIYAIAQKWLPHFFHSSKTASNFNYGTVVSYGVVVLLVIVSIICVLFITKKPIEHKITQETLQERLVAGLRFVFRNQIIMGALSLDMFAVFFGGAVALLPIFAEKILTVGSQDWGILQDGATRLGLLRAAPSVGAAVMGLVLAHRPPLYNTGKRLFGYVAGFGLCMILFALSKNFYLSFLILIVSGALDAMSVVIRSTILQLMIPYEMRGRVSAVNSIFVGSSNEIGSFESGLAAKLLGLVPSVVFGGTMTLGVVGVMSRVLPQLRDFELAKYTVSEIDENKQST
ncbi:MFS transporter [Cytophagaceae bacterium YF14B1]|uniref:MFS transporter n=1 Tax=Xanthocytophaga flava TaxID=3048013 RepID=A0AAE3QSZ7_9BACT|nr:MFS transporter [Xanthocytophaga flavus]MDJ1484815.1 MFS transporter [Xanthocytophaga flavus]